MAISAVGMTRQPFLEPFPDRFPLVSSFPLPTGTTDITRPVPPIEATEEPTPVVLPFEPNYVSRSSADMRRRYGQAGQLGLEGMSAQGQPLFPAVTKLYNPKGAPTAPLLTTQWFDARISFEPFYVHQFSMTLYAFISKMPVTLGERRQQIDIMA